jgi:MFS family permease
MRPQAANAFYFRLMNVLCRIMGLWFVFVSSTAMLVPIFALVITAFGDKNAEIISYSWKMIVGFCVGIAIGSVGLKVRSFRPDLPRPKQGQATNWWTGDLTVQNASKGFAPRLSPLLRLVLALASLPALLPLIVVLAVYELFPLEVTGIPRSDATVGVGVAAGAIFVAFWALVVTGWNPFYRE